VFAAVDPQLDLGRIAAIVRLLERAQIQPEEGIAWPGSWPDFASKERISGSMFLTSHALTALDAARRLGIEVAPRVWQLARGYVEASQKPSGGWTWAPSYDTPQDLNSTASGIVSLLLCSRWNRPVLGVPPARPRKRPAARLSPAHLCGFFLKDERLFSGLGALDERVTNGRPPGFLYSLDTLTLLEQVADLTGFRSFGPRDWLKQRVVGLLGLQLAEGAWKGGNSPALLETSLAVEFLARQRHPLLIAKLRHLPLGDWQNDHEDVRNLVTSYSRGEKSLLRWCVIDSTSSQWSEDLAQASIVFLNGHEAPDFTADERRVLRSFVEQGGCILADACCDSRPFDKGFRQAVRAIFPEEEHVLRSLDEAHPVWRAKHEVKPVPLAIWAMEYGSRVALIYSPRDLSCAWDDADRNGADEEVKRAIRLGENIVTYLLSQTQEPAPR
jgi:hypothetical protein